jgi:hypothetical protein
MNMDHGQKRGGGEPERGTTRKRRQNRETTRSCMAGTKKRNEPFFWNKENVKHDIIFPCTKKRKSQPDTIKMQTLPSNYVRGKFF